MLKIMFQGKREVRIILNNEDGRMMGHDWLGIHGSSSSLARTERIGQTPEKINRGS
jgi:hypothetical protein